MEAAYGGRGTWNWRLFNSTSRGNNKGNFSRVLLPLRKRPFVAPRLPEDTQSTKQLAQENDEGVVVTIKETDSSTCTLAMHQAQLSHC